MYMKPERVYYAESVYPKTWEVRDIPYAFEYSEGKKYLFYRMVSDRAG